MVTIPRGHGEKIKIPRWDTPITSISAALTGVAGLDGGVSAITEHGTTDGAATDLFLLCAESITGNIKQWAGGRGYTDKLILITRANFIEGALESLARELSFKLDRHTRANISASSFLTLPDASVLDGDLAISAGATASTQTNTKAMLNGKTIARIAPLFDSRHVPRWEDECFVGVTNPLCQFDIYNDFSATGFVTVARYNDAGRIYRGEIGRMYGVRWLLSTSIPYIIQASQATTGTTGLHTGLTGVNSFIFAPDAFYSIELEDGGVEVIHHPPGSGGSTGDPANQKGSIAVKVFYGTVAAPAADKRLMRFAHVLSLTW
jgi:N4-gp56 family major capsid protein